MQTILTKLTDEQAQQELPRFMWLGFILSLVGFFIFGWLGMGGVMFGSRALLLTFHRGNETQKYLRLYRAGSVLAFVIGCADIIVIFGLHR